MIALVNILIGAIKMRAQSWTFTAFGYLSLLLVLLLSFSAHSQTSGWMVYRNPDNFSACHTSKAAACKDFAGGFYRTVYQNHPSLSNGVVTDSIVGGECQMNARFPNGIAPGVDSFAVNSYEFSACSAPVNPCASLSGAPVGDLTTEKNASGATHVCDVENPAPGTSDVFCAVKVGFGLCTNFGCSFTDNSYSGQTCTEGSSPTPTATAASPDADQCSGTINGTVVKYKCAVPSTTSTKVVNENDRTTTTTKTVSCDGRTCTTAETTVSDLPDSSTRFNESGSYGERNPFRVGSGGQKLSCSSGCVTPLATPQPDGSLFFSKAVCDACYANPPDGTYFPPGSPTTTATSKTSVQDQNSFCQDNPTARQCLSGSFAGNCGSAFTCTGGDAVLCAAARGVWETKCALKPLETSATDAAVLLGRSATAAGILPTDHPLASKTIVDLGTFDQTNPFASGCPADATIATVFGSPVVVPLSSACSTFQLLGQLLVGFTLLASALWLVKG